MSENGNNELKKDALEQVAGGDGPDNKPTYPSKKQVDEMLKNCNERLVALGELQKKAAELESDSYNFKKKPSNDKKNRGS